MSDLASLIDIASPDKVIEAMYEANYKPRTYLGLSEVGHTCQRYLWYAYNGYLKPTPDGRVLRLFELGNLIESHIINDLRACGYRVFHQQIAVVFTDDKLTLKGHIDGKIEGLTESSKTHLLEIKSANEKSFNELLKLKSYEKWNVKYKTQIHLYMLGLKLERCLVIVYCKNDSRLYTERIKLNKEYAIGKLIDVFGIIKYSYNPDRACPRQDWYEAKFCNYYQECWK